MAWTTPKQWAASELLTASDINQYISDNLSALYALTQGGGRKNLLHNGAFQVAQRGTSTASITNGGYYTADRWRLSLASLGTFTQSVENDAPTGSGFRKSLKLLCTTADASPAASDELLLHQTLEGQNLQAIKKGTASAQQVTMSFWVKSNKTGTYVAELYDNDNTRSVSASYTISSSATWEQKTITFPADLTGALDNDAEASLSAQFWLSAGSTYTGGASLQTTWATPTNNKRAYGQTNLAASTDNYWQVSGVQLEIGSASTGFEFRDFGTELAECQRYYEKSYNYGTAAGTASLSGNGLIAGTPALAGSTSGNVGGSCSVPFKVRKRAVPTITMYDYDGTANAVRVLPADAKRAGVSGHNGLQDTGAFGFISFDNSSATAISSGNVLAFHWTASADF